MTPTAEPTAATQAPADRLYELITGYYVSSAIFAAVSLGVADQLDAGTGTPAELASALAVDEGALTRLLRLLAGAGVVSAREDGRFELSDVGAPLAAAAPASMRAVALQFAGPLQQRTWSRLTEAVRTGEPVFERVTGTGVFAFFADHPEAAAVFDAAMTFFGGQVGQALATGAYDFGSAKTIVDVGGGHGALVAAILEASPDARGRLFELPHVAERARHSIEVSGLGDRCEVWSGDVFVDPLPARADIYLLKSVVHDFDDDRAVEILRCCRRAMDDHSRLVIVEPMLSDCVQPTAAELRVSGSDINMLVHLGGRERTEAEFVALVRQAGLSVDSITPVGDLPSGVLGSARVIDAIPGAGDPG